MLSLMSFSTTAAFSFWGFLPARTRDVRTPSQRARRLLPDLTSKWPKVCRTSSPRRFARRSLSDTIAEMVDAAFSLRMPACATLLLVG